MLIPCCKSQKIPIKKQPHTNQPAMSSTLPAFRATELPYDKAWAPDVTQGVTPPGHSFYTWCGVNVTKQYDYSVLLGCVRPEPKTEAKAEEKTE
jgi:hypothetical protein